MPEAFDWQPEALPGELRGYELLTTLRRGEGSLTCVVRSGETGQKGLLKVARGDGADQLKNEAFLLERIHERGGREADLFPRVIYSGPVHQGGREGYALIRTYIPGRSLEEVVESRQGWPGLEREAALNALIAVMELLKYLHTLPTPVIHRDVKPQNVILDDAGTYHLIDLGISREYREGDLARDTRVMGTRLTAPPEQFGYRQTDGRSDIYSAGVLLRYCLTGEYDEKPDEALPPDIAAIVKKATMFDPQTRYQRAGDMLRDLLIARYGLAPAKRSKRRRVRWPLILAACALVILGVCAFLFDRGPRDTDIYAFREPLIEQAVRQALGRPEGGITYGDLKDVTRIYIFGKQVLKGENDLWFQGETVWLYDSALREAGLWRESGDIRTLDDIGHMPYLKALSLYKQDISDIGALRNTRILHLGLGFNPLTDLSPLRGNEAVASLNISGLDVADVRVIGTMAGLRSLTLGATPVADLKDLEGLPLEELNLCNVYLADWSDLKRLRSLKTLYVNDLSPHKVEPLVGLALETLVSTHSDHISVRDLAALDTLRDLDYRTDTAQAMDERPLGFPNMRRLYIQGQNIASLRCVSGMTQLAELSILGSAVASYEGLEDMENLNAILCSPDQRDALTAMYPDKAWEYWVSEPA